MKSAIPSSAVTTPAPWQLNGFSHVRYELRFARLSHPGHGYAFPCDAEGRIAVSRLSEQARANYLYARSNVGREFSRPVIRRLQHCGDTVIVDGVQ